MAEPARGFARDVWRRYRRSRTGLAGLALVLLLVLVGFLAPVLANEAEHPLICRYDGAIHAPAVKELAWAIPGGKALLPKSHPFNQVTFNFKRSLRPERGDWAVMTPVPFGPNKTSGRVLEPPSREHWLGTDDVGRDVLARMIHGARVSMLVGFVSTGVALLIGLVMGTSAGFFGGRVDTGISRIIEIVISFPSFFLILGLVSIMPRPTIWATMAVIGLTGWTGIARYVRGEFLRLKAMDFVSAATALGARPARLMFRHLLPNALAPIFVPVTFGIAGAILTEAALSYLGFGVRPPAPSWGNILRAGFDNIFTTAHLIFPPCVAIFVAVLAYNLVGDRLRDVVDPRLHRG
jgi:peptide/nickel transport system permease protein